MLRATALLLAVTLTGAADAPKKDKDAKAAEIEGTWNATKGSDHGNKVDLSTVKMTLTLKGGKYTIKANGMAVASGTYTVDASKTPKRIVTTASEGPDAGKPDQGIYELKGDTLKTAFDKAGQKDPPAGFDEAKYEVMEFSRVKE